MSNLLSVVVGVVLCFSIQSIISSHQIGVSTERLAHVAADIDATYKSLDASGGSVFLNVIDAATGVLIRTAASTQTLCCYRV